MAHFDQITMLTNTKMNEVERNICTLYLLSGKAFALFSGLSLGFRRKRCNKLLQLSESNCVTLAVELRE